MHLITAFVCFVRNVELFYTSRVSKENNVIRHCVLILCVFIHVLCYTCESNFLLTFDGVLDRYIMTDLLH